MRNLFLMLLAANILFFAWQHWVYEPDAGVTIVESSEMGERIGLVSDDAEEAPQTDAVAVDNEPDREPAAPLRAEVGRACLSVGPFSKVDDANNAMADMSGAGFDVTQRATQGRVFIGHWVYVDNIPTRAQARTLLAKLREGGIKEAILMAGSPGQDVISLGLFSALAGAERTELQAKSLGVEVFVVERDKEATVFWLDTRLKPGQSGSTVIEAYGDQQILRGDDATCPREG